MSDSFEPPQPDSTAVPQEMRPPLAYDSGGAVDSSPPAGPKNTRLLIALGAIGVVVLLGAGVAVGVVVGKGGGDSPVAAGRSSSPMSSSPTSEVPTLADPSDIVGTPVEAPPPSASTLALGAALSLQSTNSNTGDTATADVVVYSIQAHAESSDEFEEPTGQYVKVDVGTTGTSTASFPYNGLDFVLQDISGQIYQPTFVAGFEPAYNSGDIAQGQVVRGFVVFDIPDAATVKQVNYQVPSGVLGSWTKA